MKVVGESEHPVFPMKVKCRRVVDIYGFAYGKAVDFCGKMLEVDEEDVKKHKWFKYPDYTGTDYGVICPVCKKFVVIDKNQIPGYVKEKAEEIFLS